MANTIANVLLTRKSCFGMIFPYKSSVSPCLCGYFFSSASSRFSISGNLLNTAELFSHSLLSMAG